MKKIIMFLGIAVLCLCACSNATSQEYERFKRIYRDNYFNVVYDVKTKVQYAISMGNNNYGSLTVLVDAEGKPLLYKGE